MMNNIFFRVVLSSTLFLFYSCLFSNPVEPPVDYKSLYEQLTQIELDENLVSEINDIYLKRDVGIFHFKKGNFYITKPIGDRRTGALFVGKGVFGMKPPTKIEQDQLARFFKKDSLKQSFGILYIIFADSTFEELCRKTRFQPGKISKDAKNHLKYLAHQDDESGRFETSIMKTFLEGRHNELFYTLFYKDKLAKFTFSVNPFGMEEIRFQSRKGLINQFHRQQDYLNHTDFDKESKDEFHIQNYDIECTIPKNLDFSAHTKLDFKMIDSQSKWIYFYIHDDLEVDSVKWGDGSTAHFFHHKNNPVVWVYRNDFNPDECCKLSFYYHGDYFNIDNYGNPDLKSTTRWYPQRWNVGPNPVFNMTFHTHKSFDFIASGDKISEESNDDFITTKWKTPGPAVHASFCVGYFAVETVQDERIPPISAYMFEKGHIQKTQNLAERGVISGQNMAKQVVEDVANSLFFYQNVFGETNVSHFNATEIMKKYGQAFPGMIQLSWWTFQKRNLAGYSELFRAHEVAHQWWGLGLGFRFYHDQWLDEALATFSALWYLQTVFQDNNKYFNILKEYQHEIFNNRNYLVKDGLEAGPVWLGNRTNTVATNGDYDLIVYKKGAWIMHMLRVIMLDLRDMNEDRFINMLRDYYQTYKGKKVTTTDFFNIVSKHVDQDMSWFFDQWVYGVDIPEYKFSYSIKETNMGRYWVNCRILQKNMPDDFKAYAIVAVDFGNNRFARKRILIDKPEVQFKFPTFTEKPLKVIFNDFSSVLCKVELE